MVAKPISVTKHLERYTVRRPPPRNLDPQHDSLFSFEYERQFGPVRIYEVHGATLSDEGILFKDGRIFPLALRDPSFLKMYGKTYFLKQRLRKKRIMLDASRVYALCYDNWSKPYYHWICDALPRFIHMKEAFPDVVFLLPEEWNKGFIKETLRLLGIHNIQSVPAGMLTLVPDLYLIDFIAVSGNCHPATMLDLRDRLIAGTQPAKPVAGVYASRAKAPFKFVVNEQQIVETFGSFGVETAFFEEHSFAEQVQLMQSSKMLAGMHGANLTNMLFLPAGSHILEFREYGDAHNNCYYTLACLLGHAYYYQLCKRGDRKYDHPNRFDLVVDDDKLRKNLEMIFSRPHSLNPGG